MKRLLSIKKAQDATQRLLHSRQYCHYDEGLSSGLGLAFPYSNPPILAAGSKSTRLTFHMHRTSSPSFNCFHATRTARLYSTGLLSRIHEQEENEYAYAANKVDLQIISAENIKPASPTPDHLRTFNFSVFDRLFFNCYTPFVLFLPNTDNATLADVVTKRSKHLKDSLSEVLTRFHPFAGEIKDEFHIECNDKGVHFVEARVDQTLKEFLSKPDDLKVRELIPKHPNEAESSSPTYVASVQVNVFNCGGIGLIIKMSHKMVDATTFLTFVKAWAEEARGSPEKTIPSYAASEIFSGNVPLNYSLPSKLMTTKPFITKRFVFNSSTLTSLKNQCVLPSATSSRGPSRNEATSAFIWKAITKAASSVRPFSPQSPHVLLSLVNFRKRTPSLCNEDIGNLFYPALGICVPHSQPDLPTLFGQIRESVANISPEFVDSLKTENKEHEAVHDMQLKGLNGLFDVIDEGDGVLLSNILNSGIYEVDFGWGKPMWFYHINPGLTRLVVLNDMIKGGGVEAIVTLSPEEMKIFESDQEILSHTSVDPSPLQFLD